MLLPADGWDVVLPERFAAAAHQVIEFLAAHLPLGVWAVTRYDGEDQVYLHVSDSHYGLARGDTMPWVDTMCHLMASGAGPSVAPVVSEVPQYAALAASSGLDVGAYVGVPIRYTDGTLFGTLCGAHAESRPAVTAEHGDLVRLLASMLSNILDADLQAVTTAHALEVALEGAETDALTGLSNRRGWDRMLALEEERSARFGDPVAILALDLDGLKTVNDEQGHAAGDAVLMTLATVLRRHVRSTDVIARLGGDEFGILAPRTTRREGVLLASRIRKAVTADGVPCSVGVASASLEAGLGAAWREADRLMYVEKAARRRPVVALAQQAR